MGCYIIAMLLICVNIYGNIYGNSPISYQSLRKGVLEMFQKVGLPVQEFGLHSLRAGGATLAANSGVSEGSG
jgi:hypothetical protein